MVLSEHLTKGKVMALQRELFVENQPDQLDLEKKVIFIVGLYKCGTSWLSLALGKHPHAMSLPELDVVRAFGNEGTTNLDPKTIDERIRYIFSASNYGRLPAAVTEEARGLPFEELFDYFERNASKQIILKNSFIEQEFDRKKSSQLAGRGCDLRSYINYWNLDKHSAKQIVEEAICKQNPKDAIRNFCQIHQNFSGKFLILKSADQINHLRHLKNVMPNSLRILIVRDGRDMAISAAKFERYIVEKTHLSDIWGLVEQGFWTRLEQWAQVVRSINEYKKQEDLYLLSYEDLSNNFVVTLSKLLDWIGLNSSMEIVEQIKNETSFEKMSGGRSKGDEDVSSSMRRGISGEWRRMLSDEDKEKAWRIAGSELAMLGYENI